ncbi:hypothetical protein EVAR_7469_1 [Eumeta japonica]|uniref:Uncharacterized protein n=1 Tax=Eumeta variegata TaxID=151549 RepID=A0A4C2A5S0_EUMVA|nr:hypothetical protein EVAR_7469_1 [Eumeta japonica]
MTISNRALEKSSAGPLCRSNKPRRRPPISRALSPEDTGFASKALFTEPHLIILGHLSNRLSRHEIDVSLRPHSVPVRGHPRVSESGRQGSSASRSAASGQRKRCSPDT